jgi:hypothetical protein
MKLTNLRQVGRFKNKETGKEVNIHKGKHPERSHSYYFYLRMGKRVFVPESELRSAWVKQSDEF